MNTITTKQKIGLNYLERINDTVEKIGYLPTLSYTYSKPSYNKIKAYDKCIDACYEFCRSMNAKLNYANRYSCVVFDYGIIGYNTCTFTFAAIIHYLDKDNDFAFSEYLVFTKNNQYRIILD